SGGQEHPPGPAHCRMRGVDRDLIRGGHYGQRSCEPHPQAEHMAAPTKAAHVKKALLDRAACTRIPAVCSTPRTRMARPTLRDSVLACSLQNGAQSPVG